MNHPQHPGDFVCVIADSVTPLASLCHGSTIGSFATVKERFLSPGDSRYWWRFRQPILCRVCEKELPFLPEADLQRIDGPKSAADPDPTFANEPYRLPDGTILEKREQ